MHTALLFLLTACAPEKTPEETDPPTSDTGVGLDSDGDGVIDAQDCAPDDPYAYPGGHEVPYDGVDNDCDGEDLTDVDGDGYVGTNGGGDDCNDNNPTAHPGAEEICYNEIDDNCDGIDELPDDCDADGYLVLDDCDDTNPDIHPDAEDVWYDGIDSDCAANDDYDQDQDNEQRDVDGGTDCNDEDPAINTEADEVWDGKDNDCNGDTDQMTSRDDSSSYYGDSAVMDLGLGSTWQTLGDVDGDGWPEVAIGAPLSNTSGGRVYILPVSPGQINQSTNLVAKIESDAAVLGLGWGLVRMGDQLIVGGYDHGLIYTISDLQGGVSLLPADATGTFRCTAGGLAPVKVPDLDGDGTEDILSHNATTGNAYNLVSGAALSSGEFWSIVIGRSLTITGGSLGDINGDGLAELALQYGSFDANGAVAESTLAIVDGAQVSVGGSLTFADVFTMDGGAAQLGIGSTADIDGDGKAEALLSLPNEQAGAGRVYLLNALPSADLESVSLATITGSTAISAVHTAENVSDIDHDGVLDVLACEPGLGGVSQYGTCQSVSGADLRLGGDHLPGAGSLLIRSILADDLFGNVSRFDDTDGDGDDDLWIGAPFNRGALMYYQQD